MTHHWDELSKSLADTSLSRRESFRRLGAALAAVAGAVISPLGAGTAWGAGDPCRSFCQKCRTAGETNVCLAACRECNNDPRRLCGSCYFGYTCSDNDVDNCGACGNRCGESGPNEMTVCESGVCYYGCDDNSLECGGVCTNVRWNPDNCGACGNVCDSPLAPYCNNGECSRCQQGLTDCGLLRGCTDLYRDPSNCGACGHECGLYQSCVAGHCEMAAA